MSKEKKQPLDMLHGSLWDKIILFAIPLAITGVLEQLFNATDVAVLGQFVGKEAMAAVGNNISLIGLLINLFLGLSLGANVVIAQNLGGKKLDKVKTAVHTALLMALMAGVMITILGEVITKPMMSVLDVPPEVEWMAESYLRMFLLGMPAISLYCFEAAIMRSRGNTKTPLYTLVFVSILNLFLDLLFTGYLGMATFGVALATVLSHCVSAGVLFWSLCHSQDILHVEISCLKLNRAQVKEIIHIGLPAGIQGMVFSISNLCIQAAINSLGADAMAASAAAFIIEINVYCIINSFAQAATTFVGQNYGAGQMARCRYITRLCIWLSAAFMGTLSVIILYWAEPMLALINPDENVIQLAYLRIWYVVAPEIINCVMETLSGALRAYGLSMPPAMLALVGICGSRLLWVYFVFPVYPSYETLMAVYPLSWIITTVLIACAYVFYMKNLKVIHSQ